MNIIDDDSGFLNYGMLAQCAKADDRPAAVIAAELVKPLTKAQLAFSARCTIADIIESLRRAAAKTTERRAEQPVQAPPRSDTAQFQSWYDNPPRWVGNSRVRERFRRWLEKQDLFKEWRDRARAIVESTGDADALDMFDADWHPEGVRAHYAEKRRDILMQHVRDLVESTAERVRLETTQELLSTVFALGDGERVTWGEANVKQHEQRIELLMGNAAGNVEAAARHHAAIRMILDAGVSCLREVSD